MKIIHSSEWGTKLYIQILSHCATISTFYNIYFFLDINECRISANVCESSEVCINRPGNFECSCKSGYIRNESGKCVVQAPPTTPRTTTTERTTPRFVEVTTVGKKFVNIFLISRFTSYSNVDRWNLVLRHFLLHLTRRIKR